MWQQVHASHPAPPPPLIAPQAPLSAAAASGIQPEDVPACLAMRRELLAGVEALQLPANFLDQLLDELGGPSMVRPPPPLTHTQHRFPRRPCMHPMPNVSNWGIVDSNIAPLGARVGDGPRAWRPSAAAAATSTTNPHMPGSTADRSCLVARRWRR